MEGRKNKIYLNTGSYDTPTWTILTRVSNVKRPQSRGTSEYMYRGAENKKTAIGYRSYEINFKYETKRDPESSDTQLAMLQDSYDNGTVLDVAMMNKDIATANAKGVRGPFVVTDLPRDEADENNTSFEVTLKEVDHEENDELVEVQPYEPGA